MYLSHVPCDPRRRLRRVTHTRHGSSFRVVKRPEDPDDAVTPQCCPLFSIPPPPHLGRGARGGARHRPRGRHGGDSHTPAPAPPAHGRRRCARSRHHRPRRHPRGGATLAPGGTYLGWHRRERPLFCLALRARRAGATGEGACGWSGVDIRVSVLRQKWARLRLHRFAMIPLNNILLLTLFWAQITDDGSRSSRCGRN